MLTTAIVLGGLAMLKPAQATITLYGFEDANVPNNPGPNTTDISNTFADAYPGDNYNGVIFDDSFSVFRNTYQNTTSIGPDLYGPTNGNLALTNTDGGGTANTGPGSPGLDALNITTNQTLESVYFAPNDYGNGSFGADQVTVTAFNGSGDLASASLSLVDGLGNPLSGLTLLDTSSFFDPFAGNITGYRINRQVASEPTSDYLDLGGGGNYIADDFTFQSAPTGVQPTPEPSPAVGVGVGLLGIAALCGASRRRKSLKSIPTAN